MSSNILEMDCIDCRLSPCDIESPECSLYGGARTNKPSLAKRITRAVRDSQAKAGTLDISAKRRVGNKLDYSGLDVTWFKEHARIGGRCAVVTSPNQDEFAAHGLMLKPQRQGRMWRCQSKDPYLKSLVEPGRKTRKISRAIANAKAVRELPDPDPAPEPTSNPCQLPQPEPVGNSDQLPDQPSLREYVRMKALEAEQRNREREEQARMKLTPGVKSSQTKRDAMFTLIEQFGLSYHLGTALEMICVYSVSRDHMHIDSALLHLQREAGGGAK